MGGSSFVRVVSLLCLFIALGSLAGACRKQEPCLSKCRSGYVKDANGCRTCQCCPTLRCPFCWRGYILSKEDNHCWTCHCKWGL